jgi:Arc/MetJ-type ribon-helix-helix transcriptional regulator
MTDLISNDGTRTVEIPERTADKISDRLSLTEFESVDEYVAFALGQLLREIDRQDDEPSTPPGSDGEAAGDDGVTDEAVADRLESLGYL